MLTVLQAMQECAQCKYLYSICFHFCPRCGHHPYYGLRYDPTKKHVHDRDGKPAWGYVEEKGFGAYCFWRKEEEGYRVGNVDPEHFEELKKQLQEELVSGSLRPEPFYLTRWNDETGHVDLVVGCFAAGQSVVGCEARSVPRPRPRYKRQTNTNSV